MARQSAQCLPGYAAAMHSMSLQNACYAMWWLLLHLGVAFMHSMWSGRWMLLHVHLPCDR